MKRFNTTALPALLLLGSSLLVSACNAQPGPADGQAARTAPTAAPVVAAAAPAAQTLPPVTVHKSPDCGCCGGWVEHVRQAGFPVQVKDTAEMDAVKQRLGIAADMLSCHTAEVGGYLIEGHVPAADIQRLLAERPRARGLVLPGMPIGSPGMEMPNGYRQPFTVALLGDNGQLHRYAEHR